MKNLLFIAIISAVAFAACRKDNINGRIGDRRAILTSRNWQIISKKVNGSAVEIKDCEKDNYYVFQDNGQGRWEEGNNNCYAINGGGNEGGGNEGGGNGGDGNDSTSISTDPIPTYTEFTWSMTGDLRDIYMKNFGVQGLNPEWVIENMDYTSLTVETTEKVNGSAVTYEMELRAL